MDYFNVVLTTFLGLEHGRTPAVYEDSESSRISSKNILICVPKASKGLTVRSHRRRRERQSGQRRAPARAAWRFLDGVGVEESWSQVNFMVMSYDAVGRQTIGM